MLAKLSSAIWNRFRGVWQWYALWLAHSKFIIGICGVLFDKAGCVLLLQHRFWGTGTWGLPSGYMNSGETPESALERELLEETGYSSRVSGRIQLKGGYKLRIEIQLYGEIIGGDLKLDSSEVLHAKFFDPLELPDGLLDAHREAIQFVVANRISAHTQTGT